MKTKLKVGDKIPHYLDGSEVKYLYNKIGKELVEFYCAATNHYVEEITPQAYITKILGYALSIEAVDALIEQHEVSEGKFEDSFEFKGEKYYFLLMISDGMYYIYCTSHINNIFSIEVQVDKYEFQNNVLGYTDKSGDFPFCRTPQDAVKLYKAIKSKLLGMMNTEKKIIGYKPNELGCRNKAAIIAICSHYNFSDTIVNSEATHGVGGSCEKAFTEAGVHDIWFEPVYGEKDEEEVVDMGEFKLIIRNKKVFHKNEEITLFVKNLVEKFKDCEIKSNRGPRVIQISKITFVKTGCENSVTHLSQWRNIYNKIK